VQLILQVDIFVCQLLTENFESMRDELKHRQNECSRLRTLLASHHGANDAVPSDSHGIDPHLMNEDGELEMAYHTQMELNGSAFCSITIRYGRLTCAQKLTRWPA